MQFQYISAQAAVELHIPEEWRGLVSFNILQDGANVYVVYRNYDVHSAWPMMAGFRQIQGGRAGWDIVGPDPDVSGEGSEAWQDLQDHLLSLNHGIVSVGWPALLSYLISANEAHCAKQLEVLNG